MLKTYVADFETITDPNDLRVWAWASISISGEHIEYGNCVEDFVAYLYKLAIDNSTVYFHNLKFDLSYIMVYLFENGWKCLENKKDRHHMSFMPLISNMGQFYCCTLYWVDGKKVHHVKLIDSAKILKLKVSELPKAFNINEKKLDLDYDTYRPIGHVLTEHEKDYVSNDVIIVAKALKYFFDQGLTKMTVGANALFDFKDSIGKDVFDELFPPDPYDYITRLSYKGGWSYLNPKFRGKMLYNLKIFDKNSMYPAKMRNEKFPYGIPKFFIGEYIKDKKYDLYVQSITCLFELKDGYLPTIQVKGGLFCETEYLTSSNGVPTELVLTNLDLDLFFEHYNVDCLTFNYGVKYRSMYGIFTDWVDKWGAVKEQATIDKNEGLRTVAKFLLNNLGGKFGTKTECISKFPFLDGRTLKYYTKKERDKKPVYVAVASFMTSYARCDIIRSAQKIGLNSFVYADTDSLHCIDCGQDFSKFLDLDKVLLGKWDLEYTADRGRYLRVKCYIDEKTGGKLVPHISGLPDRVRDNPLIVNLNNFDYGANYTGKLQSRNADGGIYLAPSPFSINT